MNAVTISDFLLAVRIGYETPEREQPQLIRIDLTMETDFTDVIKTGDVAQGVDYSVVRRLVKEVAHSREFAMLEALADAIFTRIFHNRRIIAATISITKPHRWNDAVPGIVMTRKNEG